MGGLFRGALYLGRLSVRLRNGNPHLDLGFFRGRAGGFGARRSAHPRSAGEIVIAKSRRPMSTAQFAYYALRRNVRKQNPGSAEFHSPAAEPCLDLGNRPAAFSP